MPKSIVFGLVGAGAILLAILLTGCSDTPSPTPSAEAVPSPTVTAQPGVTPEPTPTPTMAPTNTPTPEPTPTPTTAPTNTPTPEPTPATATLPLGVYLTLCAPPDIDLADDATYGDLSSVLAAEADRLEALTPPAQLSEWHLLNIAAYRTAQALVDIQPKDDVVDFASSFLIAVESAVIEELREAAARVPRDVRQRMIEAHCIDPDVVPDDYTDVPDSQGDDIESTTVAAATLSLDEYLTLCATTEQDLADDATFGDFSSLFAAEADRLEALTPPVQLSEWHLLNIENFRTIQAFVELQPKDDVIDVARFFLMAAISADSEEKLNEVAARVPKDVLQRMIEAGCIDPEDLPDDYADVPDDHGNDIDDATAIRVGADVRGALDYDGDIDFFRFQAERGQSYQIDVALGTLDDSIVDLYDVGWSFLDSNDDYGDTYASRLYWEAPSSGERYVAVEGFGIGTYTLTVSIVDDHGDTAEDGVGVASDRAALVALYNATEGGSWTTSTNWLSGRPLDEWDGVTTDSGGRVTALNLVSNRLVGALPAALGDLTNLRTLILWSNDELTGPIPAWLGDLTNLRWLTLGGNGLTGEIPPELAGLSNLTSLDLRSNGLTGEIPPELAGLSNLQRLYLNHNRLTGEIPPELASLSNLTELYLNDNRLTGEIPPELGRLSNLMELGLYANQYTGEIPPELAGLSNLTSLGLYANQLTGEIPPELGGLSNLTSLILNHNRLTGGIPPELGGLSNLDFLWLRRNQLTGCIPEGLRDIETNDLWELELPDCGLEGRPAAGSFVSVSAGEVHSCGVRNNGSVACWGWDEYGKATPPAGSFVSVSAGGFHTCGVRSNGSVACWGRDGYGKATPPAGSFVSVSAGESHTCGVRSDRSVACWGSNFTGVATPPEGSFASVSAGGFHTCGVRSDGSVACWGGWKHDPTPPAGSFVSIDAGLNHTCGVKGNGAVVCWGNRGHGKATPPTGSFASVSAGGHHTCGVRSNNSVSCWGSNGDGQATPPVGSSLSSRGNPMDDHGNSEGSATPLNATGREDIQGALDYDGDIDYFHMLANSGRTYQIDVTLGTLDNSVVKLYDEDGALLDSNDDYGGTLASRLYWEAPSTSNFELYIAVEGHGTGTYTLTVAIVDDHGDDFESATRIAVGERVRTVIHDYDDRDVLVFRARPGTEYVLTLDYQTGQRRGDAAGTTMALYDAGGRVLARLRNYDFDSSGGRNKIMWQAATGGDLYIVVGNEDAFGIFELIVTER